MGVTYDRSALLLCGFIDTADDVWIDPLEDNVNARKAQDAAAAKQQGLRGLHSAFSTDFRYP